MMTLLYAVMAGAFLADLILAARTFRNYVRDEDMVPVRNAIPYLLGLLVVTIVCFLAIMLLGDFGGRPA